MCHYCAVTYFPLYNETAKTETEIKIIATNKSKMKYTVGTNNKQQIYGHHKRTNVNQKMFTFFFCSPDFPLFLLAHTNYT